MSHSTDVYGEADYNIGANQAGKRVHVVCSTVSIDISIVDGTKISEQKKSIVIGPLYLQYKPAD